MKLRMIVAGTHPWELLFGYWGLSWLIDDDILFDTFYSYPILARKLKKAGVNINSIKSVIISHDHWDHIGGLWGFLENTKGVTVYLPHGTSPKTIKRIEKLGGVCNLEEGSRQIKETVILSKVLVGDFDGQSILENYVTLKGKRGLVIVAGCSHPGAVNFVKDVKETFKEPIHAFIGGLHLMGSKKEEIIECANSLIAEGVENVIPTHCTGWRAERAFKKIFKEHCRFLNDGDCLEF